MAALPRLRSCAAAVAPGKGSLLVLPQMPAAWHDKIACLTASRIMAARAAATGLQCPALVLPTQQHMASSAPLPLLLLPLPRTQGRVAAVRV